jgi:CHASE2 domain-containing sensor protein
MELLKQILITGRGRPAALLVLLWSLTMNMLTELPPSWPSLQKPWSLVTTYFGSPFTAGRNLLFDGYQRKHPREPKSQAVTIVAIDEKSLQTYGQWPWPRYRLAELIHALAKHQPAALGLDLYMPEPDQTSPDQVAKGLKSEHATLAHMLRRLPSHEEALVKAFHEVPTVLSAAGFDQAAYTTTAGMRTWPVQLVGADSLPTFARRFDQVLASLPQLQAAAKGQALVSVDLDNGLVRQVPMVMNMGDQAVPNLALEMFRVASSSGAIKTHLDDSGIAAVEVADLTVPTLPNGNIFVHFATHKSMAPRYLSASDVIEGHVDPQMLSGKLVLLGLTGSGLTDMRTNAIGETVPGIEIQAQVIESLFEGRILQRPYWFKWAETLALLIVAGGLIWYVPRPGSLMATYLHRVPKSSLWLMLATNGLIIWIGFEIFIHTGMLFDAASFFLIISAVMGSLVSTVLVGIDNLKKSQEARQESVLQEARVASDRAVLAQLTDGQGRVPTHFGMPQQEES